MPVPGPPAGSGACAGDVGGFGDVPVGDRTGNAVVTAESFGPGSVAEPAQRQDGLPTAGELPAPGRGAAPAPLGGKQSDQIASSSAGTSSMAR